MSHRFVLLAFVFCLVAGNAFAEFDGPTVSTSGSAELRVVPDQVELTVGVESVHADRATAKSLNDRAVASIIAAAKQHGVADDDLQTDFVHIQSDYERKRGNPVRYTVAQSLTILSKDVSGFDELLAAVVTAGASEVHGIRFLTSKLREHRDQARRMAAQAAREKASLLAESLGRRVGKVHSISETADAWRSPSWWGSSSATSNTSNVIGLAAPAEGPVAPGRISVTASVNVVFELE